MATDTLADAVDYPLFVVTASVDGKPNGCLAGFVTQSSIEPVRFLVCLSRENRTFDAAAESGTLGLHLLGADQGGVASLFGEESGDYEDKFAQVDWAMSETGVPILSECAAWLEGPVAERFGAGDHEAFLLAARSGGRGSHAGQFMSGQASGFTAGHPA